jgi:hypothetical protein
MVLAENFTDFWGKVAPLFKDGGAYTLHRLGGTLQSTETMQIYTEIYAVRFDESGKLYQIGLTKSEEGGAFLNISFGELNDRVLFGTVNDAPMILQILFTAITLVTLAFVAWMLVDCIRRPLPKKALWIAMILLLGFSFGFTRSTGQSIRTVMAWNPIFAISNMEMDSFLSTLSVSLYIPFAAIYYFFNRKKLTPPPPEAFEVCEEDEDESDAA